MKDILTVGAGRICFPTAEGPEWVDFPLIAVTTHGVVLYLDTDGEENVSEMSHLEVVITKVEWSAFSLLTDMAAEKSEPSCDKCKDDVTGMVPPVCPKCFRGKRNQH